MKQKFMNILKESYYKLSEKDEKIFEEIMRDDGLGRCKPKFNIWAFLFGWLYLLYRRMPIEAMAVLVASLMVGYIMAYARFHPLLILLAIFLTNALLSGFCYYFLYLNKFSRDIDYCGEYNPDRECMKKRAKPKITYVIIAILIILILIWPWIYALITGADIKN